MTGFPYCYSRSNGVCAVAKLTLIKMIAITNL